MAAINLTQALRTEYQWLWHTCQIRPQHQRSAEIAAAKAKSAESRYQAVSAATGVPWWWIACIHHMESSARFDRHLHNGDPLTARTVQVPAGRPRKGNPPFTWEESAIDAMEGRGLNLVTDWSLPAALYAIEGYNGWGYRKYHSETMSPYLWGGTNHYTKGKYVGDNKWDTNAVSAQTGACAVLKQLIAGGWVML